ncbi:glycosyltransferase family 2 protein [Helicobacter cappadocius]|uniref:Glycosyltransferase family 2 protein n=1 Tax=Helicobacter cappadocius TaxID=3063998 RepID=A0AA90PIZ4_9HELI|nr:MULTISPECIES: glycosyltransferase family 2 protein [unclassified Helicobacter]MDO7253208.1 glycosyltransferase family 2 protein [Helicobacter sp. faydin-H75]MDP2539132.1 glycosyltransferase family 2 protein [Helicobacter sp. faydin-H76]
MPLVSVIIPSYNTSDFIGYAIDSVISQSFEDFECLIVDDASNDGSADIIQEFVKKDSRVFCVLLQENVGVSKARNIALEKAKGRFIAFLDSDDVWHRDKLKIQIEFMLSKNIVFSHTPYLVIDEQNNKLGSFMPRNAVDYVDTLKTCDIGNSTAIYDSHILGKIHSGSIRHDYEIWLKILKKHKSFTPPPIANIIFLASVRIRKGSDTYDKLKSCKRQWQVYRQIEKIDFFKSLYYFVNYAYYGVKKRFSYFGR